MGFAVWASQPSSISGAVGGSTVTMNSHETAFDMSRSAQNFYALTNNAKYEKDGGSISFANEASLTTLDQRKFASLAPGAYWTNTTVVFPCEGPSNATGTFGTLTVTIASMRVESSNDADQGGRKARQVGFKLLSTDGATSPLSYVVT